MAKKKPLATKSLKCVSKEKKLAGGEKLPLVADPGLVINVFNSLNSKMGTCMINTLKSVCGKSGRRWDGERMMI